MADKLTFNKHIINGVDIFVEDTEARESVATETADRVAADNKLQEDLTAEKDARTAADNKLQEDLTAETNARTAADNKLQEDLTAETNARTAADNKLQEDLTAEITERESLIKTNGEGGASLPKNSTFGGNVDIGDTLTAYGSATFKDVIHYGKEYCYNGFNSVSFTDLNNSEYHLLTNNNSFPDTFCELQVLGSLPYNDIQAMCSDGKYLYFIQTNTIPACTIYRVDLLTGLHETFGTFNGYHANSATILNGKMYVCSTFDASGAWNSNKTIVVYDLESKTSYEINPLSWIESTCVFSIGNDSKYLYVGATSGQSFSDVRLYRLDPDDLTAKEINFNKPEITYTYLQGGTFKDGYFYISTSWKNYIFRINVNTGNTDVIKIPDNYFPGYSMGETEDICFIDYPISAFAIIYRDDNLNCGVMMKPLFNSYIASDDLYTRFNKDSENFFEFGTETRPYKYIERAIYNEMTVGGNRRINLYSDVIFHGDQYRSIKATLQATKAITVTLGSFSAWDSNLSLYTDGTDYYITCTSNNVQIGNGGSIMLGNVTFSNSAYFTINKGTILMDGCTVQSGTTFEIVRDSLAVLGFASECTATYLIRSNSRCFFSKNAKGTRNITDMTYCFESSSTVK